jgi:hypothetical protein|nr:MAG TPA: hypothetical protein [Caudoviricetes sp.]
MAQIEKNREVKVTNRSKGTAGYQIQDGLVLINRQFAPEQSMDLTFDELEKLSWTPGGKEILSDELVIQDPEVIQYLLGGVEPEYHYTIKDIENLLLNGSLDSLLDCLDFAPEGVIDTVKDLAVKLPLNDMSKRKAILDKTGFNVTNAIQLIEQATEGQEAEKDTPKRRTATPVASTEPVRRVIIKK